MDTILQKLLDDRNQRFWNEISETFMPSVLFCNGRHYDFQLIEKKALFCVPASHLSKEAFTHELLHIWLRRKNIFITDFLLNQLRDEPLLYWSFMDNLFEQIGYCLEHVKMLPIFVQSGFEKEKFLEEDDYHQPKCRDVHLQIITSGISKTSKRILLPSLDLYVSRFFAMKSCPNESFSYDHYLDTLQKISPDLFNILNSFWDQWNKFDIEQYHPVNHSYKTFTAQFMHDLGKWAVDAIHTRNKKSIAA